MCKRIRVVKTHHSGELSTQPVPVETSIPPPTSTMASNKQELIQLHQLLAEVRVHAKNEFGLPTDVKNLDDYNEIGITSLDLNADIETQTDSLLALVDNLTNVLENHQPPSERVATPTVETTGPTVKTKQYTLTDDSVEVVDVEVDATANTASETHADPSRDEPASEPVTPDSEPTVPVELCTTSLLDNWSDVKTREDRKPVESWGDPTRAVTPESDEEMTSEWSNAAKNEHVINTAQSETSDDNSVTDVEQPDEQATLPTP